MAQYGWSIMEGRWCWIVKIINNIGILNGIRHDWDIVEKIIVITFHGKMTHIADVVLMEGSRQLVLFGNTIVITLYLDLPGIVEEGEGMIIEAVGGEAIIHHSSLGSLVMCWRSSNTSSFLIFEKRAMSSEQ
jgi:hypothetical protein